MILLVVVAVRSDAFWNNAKVLQISIQMVVEAEFKTEDIELQEYKFNKRELASEFLNFVLMWSYR